LINKRVKNFIEKYKLKEPFIVAFSGGFDSMCLLDILIKEKYSVIAVHLNHNWRGQESLQEEENCKKFAANNNIEFYSETLTDEIEHSETAAREARYAFFKKCANKFKSNVIFTAHNFDDNAETVLYRIIKGTGTLGLQGIKEVRDNLYYRPLLTTTREEIEQYCRQNNLKPNKDSSNDNVKYKRNLIRKKLIPLMKEINPNVIRAVNSLSDIAEEDFKILSNESSDKYYIRELLIENNLDYDRKKIEEIKQFIDKNRDSKSGKIMSLSKNLWLYVNNKEIKVIDKKIKSESIVEINKEGIYNFDDKKFIIKKYTDEIDVFPKDSEYRAFICLDSENLKLRHRLNGDLIKPLGCNGTQKLKKYLNEKKIPNHMKDELILLCNDKEVLWVAGVGISDKIKVKDKPTHFIELRSEYE